MRVTIILAVLLLPSLADGVDRYRIEAALNDEIFLINGELFTSMTYCLSWEEGDEITFLEGSPSAVCVSATLYNLTKKEKCEMWCGTRTLKLHKDTTN